MASSDNANPVKEQMESAPVTCAKGCGFFGNPQTGNMCSKCYKETIAKSQAATSAPAPKAPEPSAAPPAAPAVPVPPPAAAAEPAVPVAAEAAAPPVPDVSDAATSSAAAPPAAEAEASPAGVGAVRPAAPSEEEDEQPPKKVQVNKSRCWTCNRKIGLLGFQCKCDFYFCAEHRYSDRHECAFDYKAQGKQQLTKANPTIAPSKMESM